MSLEVNIKRVDLDVAGMRTIIMRGHRVRETPHLGGPYYAKYGLTLGGLATYIALVDTIRARDRWGHTQTVNGVRILSESEAQTIPAAAARSVRLKTTQKRSEEDRLKDFSGAVAGLHLDINDFKTEDGLIDLVALHKRCVEQTVAPGVHVATFAEQWHESGEVGKAMMQYMAERGLLRRWYDSVSREIYNIDPRCDQVALLRSEGRYFDDPKNVHGALPQVEGMLALEPVLAVLEDRKVTYDHLYDKSTVYTQEQKRVECIQNIALGTLALLGASGTVEYCLASVNNELWDQIGGGINHFEMLQVQKRFDADALVAQWEAAQQQSA